MKNQPDADDVTTLLLVAIYAAIGIVIHLSLLANASTERLRRWHAVECLFVAVFWLPLVVLAEFSVLISGERE